MNSRYAKWMRAMAIAGCASLLSFGCAEERAPINRVQADALAKSFFVGADLAQDFDNPDFYANGTVLDVGYGANQDGLFTAFYSNDLSIIRWEIQEDFLIGRLAYERIDGSDGLGAGARVNNGQIIYSFKIDSHFDIRRAYNPSTGEELNVIEENTSDRPWHERSYFRVDWSKNLITSAYDFDTLSRSGFFSGMTYEPTDFYINHPNDEDAPRFEVEDGYFDITTVALAKPGEVDLSYLDWGIGNVPACFLSGAIAGGTAPSGNCNPIEVTIRHSFWLRPNNDYEAQDWDGHRFQAAGAFTKERRGYARNYGMSDDQWRRFITRYNIWQRSHFYSDPATMQGEIACFTTPSEPEGLLDGDGDGTDDRCAAAGQGSRCDIFAQKCTLPFAERQVRPIVWYYTNTSDFRFYDATADAAREWDVAMKLAVQSARHAECNSAKRDDCWAAFPVPHGQMTMMKDLKDIEVLVDDCRRSNGNWDVAACEGVASGELAERGYDPNSEDARGMLAIATMDDAVVLCHSPIMAGDHPACAPGKPRLPANIDPTMCQLAKTETGDAAVIAACKAAYTVRNGDVRHHLINVVPTPQTPSPWGFGPTYADPLTGEGISASINVWANPTDRISQQTVDQARFIAGELSPAEITNGDYIEAYIAATQAADEQGGMLQPMTRNQAEQRLQETVKSYGRDLKTGVSPDVDLASTEQLQPGDANPALLASQGKLAGLPLVRSQAHAAGAFQDKYRNRLTGAQGSAMEAELMVDRHMKELAGGTLHNNLPSATVTEMASPLRLLTNPTIQREFKQLSELGMAQRGACSLDADDFAPSPSAIIGLTKVLQQKFGSFNPDDPAAVQLERVERMRRYLANKMHFSVILHEMGHTFGFRHNFVGSSNAFFFRPQYWQLRTKNGSVKNPCTELAANETEAAGCVGPRYFDPTTSEERDNMINMWAHSTTMDYAGDYTQDLLGLGAYDFHAVRMMYGDTATVFEDPKFNNGSKLSTALHETIMDSFGGILGYKYQNAHRQFPSSAANIHYSQLDRDYGLIQNCHSVDPESFRPAGWNADKNGEWSPLLDGQLVQIDGQYSRCFQQRVDFMPWDALRNLGDPVDAPSDQPTGGVGPSIDPFERTRVPYGFASDGWADTGNLSVYRHDSGADPYELFEFLISEQELRHIFDDFRRGISTFSVRGAAYRTLGRYNEKIRDGAKGVGLIKNNLDGFALEQGFIPSSLLQLYVNYWDMGDNLLASSMAFDHFARQLQRPNSGAYSDLRKQGEPMTIPLLSDESNGNVLRVPEGPMGFWQNVSFGGKRTYNALATDQGDYDRDYTLNAGAYYDKLFVPMLMAESADNFISSSLDPFVDARYRAVSMADLFPDGFRRMLANSLTNETWLKGPRVSASVTGNPDTNGDGFPAAGLGWISWWTEQPGLCFAAQGTSICTGYDENGAPFNALTPAHTRVLQPQIGWEQQKFLISMTLAYIPENQKEDWLNMMGIWSLGADSDPGFNNRIELHLPTGDVYIARTYGSEEICFEECKTVQRGIAARILEYANELVNAAYVTTTVQQNGATWYVPVIVDGAPIVKFDPGLTWLTPQATSMPPPPDCSPDLDPNDQDYGSFAGCACEHNAACSALGDYLSIPEFMRRAMADLQVAPPSMKGVY